MISQRACSTYFLATCLGIVVTAGRREVGVNLVEDLKRFSTGEIHDELEWVDVQEHAVKISSAKERVVFLTPDEITTATNMVDQARKAGYNIVTIPTNLRLYVPVNWGQNPLPRTIEITAVHYLS